MFNTNNSSNLLLKNDVAEVDTSTLKISIIAGLGVLAAIASSYFADLVYKEPDAGNFTLAAVSIFLFIIIFFLQSIFVKSTSLNTLIAIGETLGLASFLIFNNYSLILLMAIVLAYLALYASIKKSQRELKNQLIINVIKIAKFSVPKIVTAIIILVSVIYSQPFFPENINVSKNLIKSILAPTEMLIKIADNYLKLGIKKISIEMTISQIAKENNLPKEVLEASFQSIGLTIKSDESILDGVYNFVNDKIKNLDQTVRWAVFGSAFLLIFLTIKSFFWIFYWLIYVFIYLFYEILMALGFVKLSYQQISKEIIVL
ncbi:MAG: hypothetical protein AAB626_01875 [Patescibacteria group bacterium]